MKILWILGLTFLFAVAPAAFSPVWATSEGEVMQTFEKIVMEQLDYLDTTQWDVFLKELDAQGSNLVNETSARELIGKLVTGRFNFSMQGLMRTLTNLFFHELLYNMGLMAKILVISVLCGILRHMKDSFENPSVGEISYFVCYMVVVILVIQSLTSILQVGRHAIDMMVRFMQMLFPALMALLLAMGSFATSAVMQPAIALLVGVISTFLKNTMLPLIMLSAVITIINHIGSKVQLSRLGKLINNLCTWTLGGVFTIFIGVLSVQGVMAASFDGISIRTAKYAINTFVPIVGGMFSQTLDTIVGCSLLVKNAVGVAGMLLIAFMCLVPGIKILALMMIFKLSGALLEPITDPRITECLNNIGNLLTLLFVTVMGIAVMFFMTLTLIIGTGNISVMLR